MKINFDLAMKYPLCMIQVNADFCCVSRMGYLVPFKNKSKSLPLFACLVLTASVNILEAAELSVPAGATLEIPRSARLQMGCADLNTAGSTLLSAGQIQQAGNVTIATSGTMNAGSGEIQVGGNWTNIGSFIAGNSTVTFQDGCSAVSASLNGDTQFNNLVLTSQIGRTFVIEAGRNIGVSGSLTVQGIPSAPVRLVTSSQTGQIAYITLASGATYSVVDASIPPNVRIIDSTPPPPNPIPTLGEEGRFMMIFVMILAMLLARRPIPPKNNLF